MRTRDVDVQAYPQFRVPAFWLTFARTSQVMGGWDAPSPEARENARAILKKYRAKTSLILCLNGYWTSVNWFLVAGKKPMGFSDGGKEWLVLGPRHFTRVEFRHHSGDALWAQYDPVVRRWRVVLELRANMHGEILHPEILVEFRKKLGPIYV